MTGFYFRINPRSGMREQIAVDGSVKQFTAAKYIVPNTDKFERITAKAAVVQNVGTDQAYYTLEGSTPSASAGFVLDPGDYLYLDSFAKVQNFKVTRVTGNTTLEAMFGF